MKPVFLCYLDFVSGELVRDTIGAAFEHNGWEIVSFGWKDTPVLCRKSTCMYILISLFYWLIN